MGLHYNVTLLRPRGEGQRFTIAAKRCPGEALLTPEYGTRALTDAGAADSSAEAVVLFVTARGSGFQYEHAVDGRIVRALSYCETVWDRVVGEPEAWELPLYSEGQLPNPEESFFVSVERVAGAIHQHFGVPGPSAIFD
jgi:hypothetical protein